MGARFDHAWVTQTKPTKAYRSTQNGTSEMCTVPLTRLHARGAWLPAVLRTAMVQTDLAASLATFRIAFVVCRAVMATAVLTVEQALARVTLVVGARDGARDRWGRCRRLGQLETLRAL